MGGRMIAEMIRDILFGVGFLLLCSTLKTDARARPDIFCTFNGKKYSPGESWHPYLEPQGVMYCLRCTCSEDTNVSCYRIQCPALSCPNPVTDPQQCCPKCPDPQAVSALQDPASSTCQYNGTTYQQGDIFTNSALFPSRLPNQCTQCSCSEGQIYCGLVTCPELLCASPQTIPDSCCQVCEDGSYERMIDEPLQLNRSVRHSRYQCTGESSATGSLSVVDTPTGASLEFIPKNARQKGGSSTTVKIILKEENKKACVYNGKTYSHGETWHPTFRYFVPLPCILCTCRDGRQDCQKITCPKTYPCEDPQNVEGKCCKTCPDDKVKPTAEIYTTKCGVSVYMFVSSSSETPKENLRKIAIERVSSEDVDVYIWKLVKGIFHLIQIKKVKKQEFKVEVQNFRLVSRTNEAHWNMFLVQGPEVTMPETSDKEAKNL